MQIIARTLAPWLPGIVVGLVGTVVLFKDLLLAGRSEILWGNGLDPQLMHWIMEWGYHALFESGSFDAFWNSNAFYPAANTLTYSDSLLGLQLFYGPLRAAGMSSWTALYATLALTCLCGALLTQRALRRIGGFSPVEQAFIIFGAHFSLGMVSYLYHYQLFGFHFAPAFFLHLFVYLRDFRLGDLAVVCGTFCLGMSIAMYLGPLLLALSIVLVPLCLAGALRRTGVGHVLAQIGPVAPVLVALFAAALYWLLLRPYLADAGEAVAADLQDIIDFSARPAAIISTGSHFSYWYRSPELFRGAWETWYFPGFVLLGAAAGLLAMLGVRGGDRLRRRVAPHPASPLAPSLLGYAACLFGLALLLSWGPWWPWQGGGGAWLPYALFAKVIPGLDAVRAPGRFGMFLGLPLALFGVGFLRLATGRRQVSRRVGALALAVVAIESLPSFPLVPHRVDPVGTYRKVAELIRPGTPLMELPVHQGSTPRLLLTILGQLEGSTLHWGRLMVGYGAYETRESSRFRQLDERLQAGTGSVADLLGFAASLQIEHALIHLDRYGEAARDQWAQVAARPGALLMRNRESVLIRLGATE